MSEQQRPTIGSVCWTDPTVGEADTVRGFYRDVVGWKSSAVDMGGGRFCVIRDPAGAVCALCEPSS